MHRVQRIHPEHAQGRGKELLATLEQRFGMVPHAAIVMANSPAVLDGFLALSTAMGHAGIGERPHTQVKLGTNEANACVSCTSVLLAVGSEAGLTASDLVEGRTARATNVRANAALKFAAAVLESKVKVGADDLGAVRIAGFCDAEIVASVVVGCFTNLLNNAAETALDIPAVAPMNV